MTVGYPSGLFSTSEGRTGLTLERDHVNAIYEGNAFCNDLGTTQCTMERSLMSAVRVGKPSVRVLPLDSVRPSTQESTHMNVPYVTKLSIKELTTDKQDCVHPGKQCYECH